MEFRSVNLAMFRNFNLMIMGRSMFVSARRHVHVFLFLVFLFIPFVFSLFNFMCFDRCSYHSIRNRDRPPSSSVRQLRLCEASALKEISSPQQRIHLVPVVQKDSRSVSCLPSTFHSSSCDERPVGDQCLVIRRSL